MYTVTFYSFKGGVGRTMALANVGLSLARAGRRVLLVDFDLEAPGLDTFDLLRPSEPRLGLVDFVTEYRDTRVVPEVTKFIYEPRRHIFDGNLWVMPTGKQDADYGTRLNLIDWPQLYAEEDGYLLFEDLKEQWFRILRPDYVLIDSRTGHTDVGGICTRQLPDAVAVFFFPNEQNRRGLEVVVRDINRESRESNRAIEQYFIAANVPDLDDEHSVLHKELAKFRQIMGRGPDATIHHYDSLCLLQQTIFTIEHPRTKLAFEYEQLTKVITDSNLEDRSVVREFLDTGISRRLSPELIDERLKKIRRLYANDGAILYALAQAYTSLGRAKDAQELFPQAERLGFVSEERLVEHASEAYSAGEVGAARQLVRRALDATRRVFALARVLSVVVEHDVDFLQEALQALAAKDIEAIDRLYIATRLEVQRNALPAVADFIRPLTAFNHPMQVNAISELSLCLIGQRLFAEAESVILSGNVPGELRIQDSFNYAMALWGRTQRVPKNMFSQVIALDIELPNPKPRANYLQCLSISHWAVGDLEGARELAVKARQAVREADLEFSAWRYLRVKKDEFLHDLELQDAMIATGEVTPIILSDHD